MHFRYITKYQHVDPEEAVNVHVDIKSQWSIGIHWGSLVMTNEVLLTLLALHLGALCFMIFL